MNNLANFMVLSGILLIAVMMSEHNSHTSPEFCQKPGTACKAKTSCQLPPLPPKGYVRVRVGIGINDHGDWAAGGGSGMTHWEMSDEVLAKGDSLRWIVADVPAADIPPEVSATVEVE
jgi:hypothetical protein